MLFSDVEGADAAVSRPIQWMATWPVNVPSCEQVEHALVHGFDAWPIGPRTSLESWLASLDPEDATMLRAAQTEPSARELQAAWVDVWRVLWAEANRAAAGAPVDLAAYDALVSELD